MFETISENFKMLDENNEENSDDSNVDEETIENIEIDEEN